MQGQSSSLLSQPLLGAATMALALLGITASWLALLPGSMWAENALSMVFHRRGAGLRPAQRERTKELHETTRQIVESMTDTVELRDPYTGGHSRRVTELTAGILREMGMHGSDVDLIVTAARVHDIGKIGMPDHVLLKDGNLTPEESAIMKSHPERGAELLKRYPDFAWGADIVRHHHERWDGAGYPHRRKGTEIPFGARVIAVADSFDAMTSDRPYRRGMTVQEAAAVLREGRGTQWDATLVDAFLRSIAPRLGRPATPQLRIVSDPLEDSELAAATGRA